MDRGAWWARVQGVRHDSATNTQHDQMNNIHIQALNDLQHYV